MDKEKSWSSASRPQQPFRIYVDGKGWEEAAQPAVSGRERMNINGLIDAYDVTDVTAHDCDSVNAQSTKALYEASLEKHPGYTSYRTMPDITGTESYWNGWQEQR